ncbi:hypothetical protein M9H77_07996 [Catharanthus roseus]|uniref:Uncharacterized protein n=1 Tax=Catharanthus roseus TaxID=4058 RepID=A0ACC0BWM9_CATRO|nr:hypothetical protein M9H77_07996 [Catharanthus roseus]
MIGSSLPLTVSHRTGRVRCLGKENLGDRSLSRGKMGIKTYRVWLSDAFAHDELYQKLHTHEPGHKKAGQFVEHCSNEFWKQFCILKTRKTQEHEENGTHMSTDMEMMYEIGLGLRKGHTYGFGEAKSACLHHTICAVDGGRCSDSHYSEGGSGVQPESNARLLTPTTYCMDPWLDLSMEKPVNASNNECLKCLSSGPSKRVKSYHGYFVNGFRFHTLERGSGSLTYNYGVRLRHLLLRQQFLFHRGRLFLRQQLLYLRGHLILWQQLLYFYNSRDHDSISATAILESGTHVCPFFGFICSRDVMKPAPSSSAYPTTLAPSSAPLLAPSS